MAVSHDLQAMIDDPALRRSVSAVDLAERFLGRIEQWDGLLNAFVTVTPELALADAAAVDQARSRDEHLPLDGLPIVVKDNIDVGGVRRTVASRLFDNHIASADAEVVRRLRAAGAVILGKTNLHELCFGATTDNPPPFGPCRNPWDVERSAGGSSGGSGAALAADLCIGAVGSDTGGSVRIPAALDGVVGLRPTYGSVSTRGAFPMSWSLDTVGPMARSAVDVARLLEVMAGDDPADPRANDDLAGLVIGVPTTFFFEDVAPDIETCVRDAVETLSQLGAGIDDIAIPVSSAICAATAVIIRAEALALHRQRLEQHPDLFGPDIRRRLTAAGELRGWEVAHSLHVASEWRQAARTIFQRVAVVASPTTRITAPKLGEGDDVATTWNLTYLTYPWSLALVPAISLPCGFTEAGHPVGLQLAAAPGQERTLLRVARLYQEATDWHRQRALMGTASVSTGGC